VQRLGKNHGGYHGERIDIRAVLRDVESAARQHGWSRETFLTHGEFHWLALHRAPSRITHHASRIHISAGIHGDEPAAPLAIRPEHGSKPYERIGPNACDGKSAEAKNRGPIVRLESRTTLTTAVRFKTLRPDRSKRLR
jgi:hypothetical protein